MQVILNAALPIFALILTGYLCGRFGMFTPEGTNSINRFAAHLALPALLFAAMSRVTPDQLRQLGFALSFGGATFASFAVGFALTARAGRPLADQSIGGLNASYSNIGFMGIALCLLVFGEAGLQPAVVAVLITACMQFLFALALIEFDVNRGRGFLPTGRMVVVSLVTNPLFLAPIAGLAIGMGSVPLPVPVERFATLLGGAAAPCALICVGLFFAEQGGLHRDLRPVAILVVCKLVAQPALAALFVFHVFDVPPLWAKAAVLLCALPVGPGAFTLAKLYGLEAGLTSSVIVASHMISVATISALLVWIG